MTQRPPQAGFTLLELLAVVGLMAAVLTLGVAGWRGHAAGAARDGAVALLASRVEAARALAVGRGEPVRLCVHYDSTEPERFLRYVVLAVPAPGGWRTVEDGWLLPAGVGVLPAEALSVVGPGAIRRTGDDWTRGSGGALRSTALRTPGALGGEMSLEGRTQWLVLHFSAAGGVQSGDLLVALVRRTDESVPVTLLYLEPDDVAGLTLSSYGVATTGRGRAEF